MRSYLALAFAAMATAQTSSLTTTLASSAIVSGVSASQIVTGTASVLPPSATMYPVDPNTITPGQKNTWCQAQRNSCRQLCNMAPKMNDCDNVSLEWTCQCLNGPTPDVTKFNETIPYFECTTYVDSCIASTDDAETQQACLARTCGGPVLPVNFVSGGSSSTMASMMTSMASASGGSATAAATTSATAAGNFAPTQAAQNFGLALIAGGVGLAAFML